MFHFYNLNGHNWAAFTIGHYCNLKIALADAIEVHHIGCLLHKSNLQVSKMRRNNEFLHQVIQKVEETTSACRRRLKNRAILRNLTLLSLIV